MNVNITSVYNPAMTANSQYLDVVLRIKDFGDVPCTLANNDYTPYLILDANTDQYVSTTNHDLYVKAAAGEFGNVAPFVPNLGNAKAIVVQGITDGCDAITSQIVPSQTKQLAYQNALMLLSINNGIPPSTGSNATLFSNLALTWGMSAANFAALILNMQALSISLATLEISTQTQINNAVSVAQLLTELNTYETAIDTLITTLNASLPIPIQRPARIILKGINS